MHPTALDIRDAIARRETTAEQTVAHALDAVDRLNPALNAFLDIYHDTALTRAREIDAATARGEDPGSLAGVPIALKDNICFGRTTAGSRFLENYRSPFTATAAGRLIDAGAVVVGKTNMDEFGMGSSGEHSAFGPTRNPWDTDRTPGGSSSGSAAAVAAGIVPLALGSDTGGSVREPAAMSGVVGLKPTYGRVSRYGLIAFASSLDQIGPIGRTVADCAAALAVMAGLDPRDCTSADRHIPAQLLPPRGGGRGGDFPPIESLRLGLPRQALGDGNHPAVRGALDRAVRTYRSLGARIIEVDLARSDQAIAAYYIIASAEAGSNLARFDGIRYGRRPEPGESLVDLYTRARSEGFGAEVKRRIVLGAYVLSAGYYDAYYNTALKARRLIKADFDAAFDPEGPACHALITPTAPEPAFPLGQKLQDPMALYLEDVYTVGPSLAGLPAISVPAGLSDGLPVGVQLIAPAWEELTLLRAARMLEVALGPMPEPSM